MDRRAFLLTASAAALSTRFSLGQTFDVTAKTASGQLRGEVVDGVRLFRGVPFAQPPVGPLRFKAPKPVAAWAGVRDATRFAAEAIQPGKGTIPQSEDCLYLNVWAPDTPGPHPVFVWIHGGGFTGGRSFDPVQDGATFARNGIVVVTLAYRLGVFGFLDFGPTLGAEYAGGANNGLRDLTLALQWLQTNLPSFGGDPHRVTVGGESAGAKLTDILMGAPSARPLFQQMISESGGAERVFPAARAAEIAASFTKTWGKPTASLLTASPQELLEAQEAFIRESPVHFPLRPQIDGTFLPRSPLDAIHAGSTKGKRLLLGTNRDESALFIGPHPAKDPGAHDLGNLTVDQFAPLEARYATLYPDMDAETRRIRALTAEEYWIPSLRVADAHLTGGGTAFVYRFDYAEPTGHYAGRAYHSAEIRYAWGKLPTTATDGDRSLANGMHAAWTAFIRGDAPTGPGLPTWPVYSSTTRPTMLLDTTNTVLSNPQASELKLWDGLLEH